VLDHNAVLGPHSQISNFIFANGFSGHGLQQSPAVGRGIAELILYGQYRALDLSSFSYQRIVENRPLLETAII
jgi:glycine/D-amino acid oxidase-like deaminating enzyme